MGNLQTQYITKDKKNVSEAIKDYGDSSEIMSYDFMKNKDIVREEVKKHEWSFEFVRQ